MTSPARITVLGIHRLEFDESWVEGHLETICPPYGARVRAEVREMLESTVLIELLVTDRDERFDVRDIGQSPTHRSWSWLYPVGLICVWFLTADGEERFEFEDDQYDGTAPPVGIKNFRVALYFRGWDAARPLLSSYGELRCPELTVERYAILSQIAPYLSGD